MDISNLTVSEVSRLLQQHDGNEELLGKLKKDNRISVAKLLNSWYQKKEQRAAERERIHRLYAFERELYDQGLQYVAGVDEAGRGPLAGPVVVGAVILPEQCQLPALNDSKQLTPARREELYTAIHNRALAVSYAIIDVSTIDTINIYQATVQGMYQALHTLDLQPEAALIDAVPLRKLTIPHQAIINGDALSASIAAASIIAKVERDRLMAEYDKLFPEYGFGKNKGYATKEHQIALQRFGPCPIHRKSFEPVKSMVTSPRELTLF